MSDKLCHKEGSKWKPNFSLIPFIVKYRLNKLLYIFEKQELVYKYEPHNHSVTKLYSYNQNFH